jgi:hypothetical protein
MIQCCNILKYWANNKKFKCKILLLIWAVIILSRRNVQNVCWFPIKLNNLMLLCCYSECASTLDKLKSLADHGGNQIHQTRGQANFSAYTFRYFTVYIQVFYSITRSVGNHPHILCTPELPPLYFPARTWSFGKFRTIYAVLPFSRKFPFLRKF